jgi:hypothetical protein
MPHTIPSPLSPEELEAFTLNCIVCTHPIPPNRATRRKETCSIECYDKLRQWRRHLMSRRKCLHCLAPYTEQQVAEFRRWRQETQGMRLKQGRPKRDPVKPVDTAPPERDSISADQATT